MSQVSIGPLVKRSLVKCICTTRLFQTKFIWPIPRSVSVDFLYIEKGELAIVLDDVPNEEFRAKIYSKNGIGWIDIDKLELIL